MMDYKLELNKENALRVRNVLQILIGPPALQEQRYRLCTKIETALAPDADWDGIVQFGQIQCERITVMATRRELDAVWYGLQSKASDQAVEDSLYRELRRVASLCRLSQRWDKQMSALPVQECDELIDGEPTEVDGAGES